MPKILNIGVCKNSISNVDVSKKTTAVYQASANYPFHQKTGLEKIIPFLLGENQSNHQPDMGILHIPSTPTR